MQCPRERGLKTFVPILTGSSLECSGCRNAAKHLPMKSLVSVCAPAIAILRPVRIVVAKRVLVNINTNFKMLRVAFF